MLDCYRNQRGLKRGIVDPLAEQIFEYSKRWCPVKIKDAEDVPGHLIKPVSLHTEIHISKALFDEQPYEVFVGLLAIAWAHHHLDIIENNWNFGRPKQYEDAQGEADKWAGKFLAKHGYDPNPLLAYLDQADRTQKRGNDLVHGYEEGQREIADAQESRASARAPRPA